MHRGALRLLPYLLIAAAAHAGAAGPAGQVPDACRIGSGDIAGESATMACYGALDIDGDGALSPGEAAALPRLRGRFQDLDLDGNGILGPEEFQAGRHTPAQRGGGKGV